MFGGPLRASLGMAPHPFSSASEVQTDTGHSYCVAEELFRAESSKEVLADLIITKGYSYCHVSLLATAGVAGQDSPAVSAAAVHGPLAIPTSEIVAHELREHSFHHIPSTHRGKAVLWSHSVLHNVGWRSSNYGHRNWLSLAI